MKRIELKVRLVVRSPFLFADTVVGRGGLDRVALRDSKGRAIVPAEQVRGVLLHAGVDTARAMQKKQTLLAAIFGEESAEARDKAGTNSATAASFLPKRGRISFSDLVAVGTFEGTRSVRVKIEPETGAADEGKLMFAELVAPVGADVTFEGTAVLMADQNEAKDWLPLLLAAPSWISAIGAMKSAGFGEVISFTLSEIARADLAAKSKAMPKDRQGYQLRFDRPFVVDARRIADNIYVGQQLVPGGVLKGALARKLELCGRLKNLGPALSALSISHAKVEDTALTSPLSMVVEPSSHKVGDALLVPSGQGVLVAGKVALYRGDWKAADKAAVRAALGLGETPHCLRSLRTHVAIKKDTGIADDGRLFVTDAVEPDERVWTFQVDYSPVANAAHRAELAAMLEGGLDGIGRTGAIGRIASVTPPDLPKVLPILGHKDQFAVVLETDAVMASPEDGEDAAAAYAAWWRRVLPAARLEGFYASQRLAGGYIARRFVAGQSYSPFWITEAGSVFRLSGDIAAELASLTLSRLPAPWLCGKPTNWESCPYQPENGYGEIRCDHVAALAGEVSHV